jgi:hypothetical protein
MADETYQPKVYMEQGGDALRVKSGGQIETGEVADVNTLGGVPVIHRIAISDASGDTNVVLDHKTRVIDAWAVKKASNGDGANDSVTVKNGTNAITDAMVLGNDKTIVRAGEIDDAQHEIAAGGTLKVTAAKTQNVACVVYVLGIRIA